MYSTLRVEKSSNGVCEIILNRPEVLNAYNTQMQLDLQQALDESEADQEVKVILLRGEGRAFCAGGDVKEALAERDAFGWYTYLNTGTNRLIETFVHFQKPLIAAVHGPCVGAGFSMALCCDVVLASRDTYFSAIYVKIGNKPDFGMLYLLPQRVPSLSIAKDIVFTGRKVTVEEGERYGFVNRIYEPDTFLDSAKEYAGTLAEGPGISLQLTKAVLNRSPHLELDTVLQFEALTHGYVKQSEDHKEGVRAFREKRAPNFKGK